MLKGEFSLLLTYIACEEIAWMVFYDGGIILKYDVWLMIYIRIEAEQNARSNPTFLHRYLQNNKTIMILKRTETT